MNPPIRWQLKWWGSTHVVRCVFQLSSVAGLSTFIESLVCSCWKSNCSKTSSPTVFLYNLNYKSRMLGRWRQCWRGKLTANVFVVQRVSIERLFFVRMCFIFRPRNVELAQNSSLTFFVLLKGTRSSFPTHCFVDVYKTELYIWIIQIIADHFERHMCLRFLCNGGAVYGYCLRLLL